MEKLEMESRRLLLFLYFTPLSFPFYPRAKRRFDFMTLAYTSNGTRGHSDTCEHLEQSSVEISDWWPDFRILQDVLQGNSAKRPPCKVYRLQGNISRYSFN